MDPLTVIPHPCASVRVTGARILLSQNTLDDLSRNRIPTYQNEAQRLALIAGDRARLLLDGMSSETDESGCAKITLGEAFPQRDALYLVGQLLEGGQAVVVRDGTMRPELKIVIHDYNVRLSGERSFEFLGGGVFFSLLTWVS
ncbi:hypothetical protein [Dyella sp. Tek66A03]|uniref:hypothetical protein n=1 Tax=Dyella sp. Tek66A03 TaxID=3458298 RepID=UPI00403EDEC9